MTLSRYCCAYLLALIFLFTLPGCYSYYSTATPVASASSYPGALEKARKNKKYMVLHSGINLYSITHVQVDKAKEHFTVQLDKVNSSRTAPVLSELHVYTKDSTSYTMDEPHTIPFSNVAKVEVLGKD